MLITEVVLGDGVALACTILKGISNIYVNWVAKLIPELNEDLSVSDS